MTTNLLTEKFKIRYGETSADWQTQDTYWGTRLESDGSCDRKVCIKDINTGSIVSWFGCVDTMEITDIMAEVEKAIEFMRPFVWGALGSQIYRESCHEWWDHYDENDVLQECTIVHNE